MNGMVNNNRRKTMTTVIRIIDGDYFQETRLNGKYLGGQIVDKQTAEKLIAEGAVDAR
jgi:hypothetical protein